MSDTPLSTEDRSPAPQNPTLTKEEAEDFFGIIFYGKHHIPGEVKPFGRGWKINAYSGHFATFDYDNLTRLVFLCHDMCIRAEFVQGGPGRIGIAIWRRGGREGDMYFRHPTIDQALEKWRKTHPAYEAVP